MKYLITVIFVNLIFAIFLASLIKILGSTTDYLTIVRWCWGICIAIDLIWLVIKKLAPDDARSPW